MRFKVKTQMGLEIYETTLGDARRIEAEATDPWMRYSYVRRLGRVVALHRYVWMWVVDLEMTLPSGRHALRGFVRVSPEEAADMDAMPIFLDTDEIFTARVS